MCFRQKVEGTEKEWTEGGREGRRRKGGEGEEGRGGGGRGDVGGLTNSNEQGCIHVMCVLACNKVFSTV